MSTRSVEILEIGSRRNGFAAELREIWAARELLYFLTVRDIKLRYKQTAVGVAWAVLQPVVTTAIFALLFSRFARFDTGDVPYPLFALAGLMLWLFIHSAVSFASGSFVNHTNLVTKVYFPRMIVPLAATLAALFDLIFSVLIFVGMMAYYRFAPGVQVVWALLFLVLALVLGAAMGILLAAVNVRFRDVKFALPFFLQVWMIASPVFYPASMISEKWRLVFAINPLVGILDGFRSAVFGAPFDWPVIGISMAATVVLLIVGITIFRWMEDSFADIV